MLLACIRKLFSTNRTLCAKDMDVHRDDPVFASRENSRPCRFGQIGKRVARKLAGWTCGCWQAILTPNPCTGLQIRGTFPTLCREIGFHFLCTLRS